MRALVPLTCTLFLMSAGACGSDGPDGAVDAATLDTATTADTIDDDTAIAPDTTVAADTAAVADTEDHGDTEAPVDTHTPIEPAACASTDDCAYCLFTDPVASPDDCYCTICATTPLNGEVCADYGAQYAEHCPSGWDEASPCPVPRCMNMPPVACDEATSTCVNSCDLVSCEALDCPQHEQFLDAGACCARCPERLDVCEDGTDCKRCVYSKPVVTVDDCYCTMCATHPATTAQCDAWAGAWQATCSGAWAADNPCPIAICLPPQPVGCLEGACVGCDQVVCEPLDCPTSRQRTVAGDCCPSCAPPPAPCSETATCSWCPLSRGVESPSECYCTMCATFGVTEAECAQWSAEWDTHCSGQWALDNPCPVAICLPRPPITCGPTGACVAAEEHPAR